MSLHDQFLSRGLDEAWGSAETDEADELGIDIEELRAEARAEHIIAEREMEEREYRDGR